MKSLKPLVLAALLLSACLAAGIVTAQSVYRCGNSYSQTPCVNGTLVQTDDPRSEAQRSQAKEAQAQDKQLAKELETSRRKEEALALQREQAQQAARERIAAAQTKAEAKNNRSAKPHKKPGNLRTVKVQEPGVFTAIGAAEPPKKTKPKTRSSAP